MSFELIHIDSVLQDSGRKEKSPVLGDVSISAELIGSPCLVRWDASVFGVDNNGVPL